MPNDYINDYSTSAGSNTDVGGIDIDENCAPAGLNDAIREVMSHLAGWKDNFEIGADIASAGALAVNIVGMFHDVTGTTTITSLAAATNDTSKLKFLQFDGALTLTHHATDLILPGAANITTAAGDIGIFYEYAAGDWRCVSYMRAAGASNPLVSGTVQATTSGTTKDFTGIPSWVKKITISGNGVSTNGSSTFQIVIGDSGGFETSGYTGGVFSHGTSSGTGANQTGTGFDMTRGSTGPAGTYDFVAELVLLDASTNTWAFMSQQSRTDSALVYMANGAKSLSGVLTQLRFTTSSADTFDAGKVNILYE